jgi:clan AA aspartic protease
MERIKVTNSVDVGMARVGVIRAEQVRSVEIDALVDTGATMLVLPAEVVAALGLEHEPQLRRVRYANGTVGEIPWVAAVRVTICGRETSCDALVEAIGTTPLIGQIPLEALDLHVDPKNRTLHVNPASPDAPLLDLLSVA